MAEATAGDEVPGTIDNFLPDTTTGDLLQGRSRQARREDRDDHAGGEHGLGPYCHPIWKQLAMRNGEINRMNKLQIKDKLAELHLDTRGVKEVLKKRLKNHYRTRKLQAAKLRPKNGDPHYDFILVIDFEATCQENNPADFKYEIIEFPIVMIDWRKQEAVSEFHSYVKPELNPKLSTFCTTLTGISQARVDQAPTFSEVFSKVLEWMKEHHLGDEFSFAVASDGPWDMSRFLFMQCKLSGLPFPDWAHKWINVRKAFSNYYGFRRAKLSAMLENMGMTFEGQQHSGIDDSRNIARIVIRMLQDGCELRTNERLHAKKARDATSGGDVDVEPIVRHPGQDSGDSDNEQTFSDFHQIQCEHRTADGGPCSNCLLAEEFGRTLSLSSGQLVHHNHRSENKDGPLHANTDNREKDVLVTQVAEEETINEEEDYDDLLAYYALQHS